MESIENASLSQKEPLGEIQPKPLPDFKIPICYMTYREITKQKPEIAKEMKIVLDFIDEKSVDNFNIHHSRIFPGVAFSYTVISVTPELISKLTGQNYNLVKNTNQSADTLAQNNDKKPENRKIFIYTPFAPPPDGNGLSGLDAGIDRLIRNIPKVASALEKGQTPPQIDTYCLGTPVGFGGHATVEYRDELLKNGFDTNGKLYGEFMNDQLQGLDPENTYVLAQGASMGAINASNAVKYLTPEFRKGLEDKGAVKRTQLLLDVPAGHHNPRLINRLKGVQTALGLGAETLARVIGDPKMKGQGKRPKRLYKYLSEAKNIPQDNLSQTLLKIDCLLFKTGLKLVKGSPLNTENRSFVRYAIFDPLTTGPVRAYDVLNHKGQFVTTHSMARRSTKEHKNDAEYQNNPYPIEKAKVNIPAKQVGRSLQFPSQGTHYWAFTNRMFERWEQIFKYCQSKNPEKPNLPA